MSDLPQSNWWRLNSPMLGVSVLLLLAFAALALIGRGDPMPRENGSHTARPDFAALPASPQSAPGTTAPLSAQSARARNAATQFSTAALKPAKSFLFGGNSTDRLRARECLALAALAEAGAGDEDQRAVMQVVLNRVRHPAFADTVCGVVFQGAERATGCQFTFTCDGSLARSYPESLWRAARERAEDALGGRVYAPVGNATHYHTDWVYPWWSNKLDKVAQVGTHLFFRWRGFWGTPQALSARYDGGEPDPLTLRGKAVAVDQTAVGGPLLAGEGEAVRSFTAPPPAVSDMPMSSAPPDSPAPGVHFVLVGIGDAPAQLVERARALCPGTRYCQIYGWSDAAAIPMRLPLSDDARRSLRFSFLAARNGNAEVAYFDCRLFPAPALGNCLPHARP